MNRKFQIRDRVRILTNAVCNFKKGQVGIIRGINAGSHYIYSVGWGTRANYFRADELELAIPIKRRGKK